MAEQNGNPWYERLDRHMRTFLPETVAELSQKDYEDFLTSRVAEAKDSYVTAVMDGTDPRMARSMILTDMFPPAEDDQSEITALEIGGIPTENSLLED